MVGAGAAADEEAGAGAGEEPPTPFQTAGPGIL